MGEGDMTAPEKVGHTQLPWRSQENGAARNLIGADETRHHMILIGMVHNKDGEFEANAEFIVRAVNHHEEMVKALARIREIVLDGDSTDEEACDQVEPIVRAILAKLDAEVPHE